MTFAWSKWAGAALPLGSCLLCASWTAASRHLVAPRCWAGPLGSGMWWRFLRGQVWLLHITVLPLRWFCCLGQDACAIALGRATLAPACSRAAPSAERLQRAGLWGGVTDASGTWW